MSRAVQLREDGATISEIAEALNLPRSTVGDLVLGVVPLPHAGVRVCEPDADAERLATLTRVCSRCLVPKPWTDYQAAMRWPDGTMQRPQARCYECVKAARRLARRIDPEAARARDRADWKRLMADPIRRVKRRETQRENSAVFRLRHTRFEGEASG